MAEEATTHMHTPTKDTTRSMARFAHRRTAAGFGAAAAMILGFVALTGCSEEGLEDEDAIGFDSSSEELRRCKWWGRCKDPRPTPPPAPTASTGAPSTPPPSDPSTPPPSGGPSGYPDETNTGAKGTLTPRSGDITVNVNGTILENIDLKGAIRVYADNVTIRNVKITTGGYWPILFDGTGGVVEDSTIVGTVDSQACVGGSGMTIRRLNCSGAGDGVKLGSDSTMTDSYIHDLGTGPESHNDGCELGSKNVTVRHNTILNAQGQTAAVFIGASAPSTNILVEDNVLAGGGYTVYGPDPGSSNVRVVNNKFSTRYFAKSGFYGPVAYWKTGSGNEWSGNVWMDGASAGETLSP